MHRFIFVSSGWPDLLLSSTWHPQQWTAPVVSVLFPIFRSRQLHVFLSTTVKYGIDCSSDNDTAKTGIPGTFNTSMFFLQIFFSTKLWPSQKVLELIIELRCKRKTHQQTTQFTKYRTNDRASSEPRRNERTRSRRGRSKEKWTVMRDQRDSLKPLSTR